MNRYEVMHGISDELKTRGYKTEVEGGGAAAALVTLTLPNGILILIGDANETWGADVYPNQQTFEYGTICMDGIETPVPCEETCPKVIVDALIPAIEERAKLPKPECVVTFDSTMNETFKCVCGNTTKDKGATECDYLGNATEPLSGYPNGLYRCDQCGRVFDGDSGLVKSTVDLGKVRLAWKADVARWETKGAKHFLQLQRTGPSYHYTGNGCGGSLPELPNDTAAIKYMEEHAVSVLKSDFSSTKRVK